jgi:hypothetical protein
MIARPRAERFHGLPQGAAERSCLGILRLARQHPVERLEVACRRVLAAGAHSSGYVEQLLKSRRPIPDPLHDDGRGLHDNLRGSSYYH